jgi:hypothetical protein
LILAAALAVAAAAVACGPKASPPAPDAAPAVPSCGAPVGQGCWASGRIALARGCQDRHCYDDGGAHLAVDFGLCRLSPASVHTGATPDQSDATLGTAMETDDDGCTFHVRTVPHCAAGDRQLSLDVQITDPATGTLVTRADPYVVVSSSPTHVIPPTATTTELSPGHYRIEPIAFDASGVWTVTLHYFGACPDSPRAPHGHASFLIDVP